jgi:hypothetical protein
MLGEARYWKAVVVITTINDKGKEKNTTENHIVWGKSPADVEVKVKEEMSGSMEEWTIKTITDAKVTTVYGKED